MSTFLTVMDSNSGDCSELPRDSGDIDGELKYIRVENNNFHFLQRILLYLVVLRKPVLLAVQTALDISVLWTLCMKVWHTLDHTIYFRMHSQRECTIDLTYFDMA